MSNDTTVETFAREAREWMTANLEVKFGHQRSKRSDHRTREELAPDVDLQRRLAEAGYAGITWPTRFGGRGLTVAHQRAFDAVSRDFRMPELGIAGGTTALVCGPTLLVHASESFNEAHIRRMMCGEELWIQLFSEPNAGSDLAAVLTSAVQDGDEWVLTGSKVWSSAANYADYGLCLARTDWSVPKHRGLTWFAVPLDAPGVTVRPIREISGSAEFCEVFLDDVRVHAENVIGQIHRGWDVTRTMLAFERLAGDVEPDPPGRRMLAPDLVALADQLGRSGDPLVRDAIAMAHVNDVVQAAFRHRLAARHEAGTADHADAGYGKLAAGVYTPIRARIALEIAGVDGITWPADDADGSTIATDYLNGRILSIAGGTNEMQRNGIGEAVLGLPREPAVDLDVPFADVVRGTGRSGLVRTAKDIGKAGLE
jgi:alkylation response protein AidB-like acyl-CoA dehydrogenase